VAGLVVLGLSGIWSGAERSAPGDRLYSAKRAIEAVRLFAALSPESKAEACLDIGWRRLEEAGRVIREGRTSELAALVEDMSTAYTLALTYAERAGSRRIDHLAQSETRLAFDEVTRLAAQAGPPAASLLARVNLVLGGTSQGRRIVAVTIPQPTALARPTQLALIPGASPTPGVTAEGSPGAAATASPAAPPATSPTAQADATNPPRGATPSATSPASPFPPASPTAAASPSPATPVPPPSATPIRPKPVRRTATATAPPPPEEPSRTPKPWATDTPPPTAAPPTSRPGATPDPGIPTPSVEPPSPGLP